MERKKIAILFGGCSTEYNVSLQSAYSVITHLNQNLYDVILIGITRDGKWLKYNGGPEQILNNTWFESSDCIPAVISPSRDIHGMLEFHGNIVKTTKIDVAFPVLHGKNGEDGTLQGLLELAGIPFVGCHTLSSAMCMDKDIAHKIVELAGVTTPTSMVLTSLLPHQELVQQTEQLSYPLFVKPAKAGSSIGITKIEDKEKLFEAVKAAFEHDSKVVIEEEIKGFEVGCAVLGNDRLTIGEVDEIELTEGFFDYTEKYTLKTSKIYIPARIDEVTAERIKTTAAVIYRALNCSGLARVDMFLTLNGDIVFNEVNTLPGFTSHSRYPSMLNAIGMSFEELLDNLIWQAIKSW